MLLAGAELAFYWPDRTLPPCLSIKVGSGTDWSSGFHLSFGTIWIRMRNIGNTDFQCARYLNFVFCSLVKFLNNPI